MFQVATPSLPHSSEKHYEKHSKKLKKHKKEKKRKKDKKRHKKKKKRTERYKVASMGGVKITIEVLKSKLTEKISGVPAMAVKGKSTVK
jgi:hypothetical protein